MNQITKQTRSSIKATKMELTQITTFIFFRSMYSVQVVSRNKELEVNPQMKSSRHIHLILLQLKPSILLTSPHFLSKFSSNQYVMMMLIRSKSVKKQLAANKACLNSLYLSTPCFMAISYSAIAQKRPEIAKCMLKYIEVHRRRLARFV